MDQPQQAETPPCPPDATAETRRALGYNALARLAGADCGRFVAIADYLRGQGLSAPKIYAADIARGLVLIEDLGDLLFDRAIADGEDEQTLYAAAINMLAAIHRKPVERQIAPGMNLHPYDITALLIETDLLLDWYVPLVLGRSATNEERDTHRGLWVDALHPVTRGQKVFVHRDFHAQNLLWLPQRHDIERVGVIDFQDGVIGSPAYDIVSLLEDARRDVDPDLAKAMIAQYISLMGAGFDEAGFRTALAVMAAQRNAKIVGIFARLHSRDEKSRYLDYLPRVWGYLGHDLEHTSLAPLRDWYAKLFPQSARHGLWA